jgi:hypothetical protein
MDVDHVYTWVNTVDANFLYQRALLAAQEVKEDHAYRAGAARIADHGELRASLRSAKAFLPFVRRTIIFGAGQRPEWLDEFAHVEYVEQSSVIPEPIWPTYQSDVVETYLHRIPDLAEHYIYSNDDFFFAAPHEATDFFTSSGQAKVALGRWFLGQSPAPTYRRMEQNSIVAMKQAGIRFPSVSVAGSGKFRRVLPRHRLRMLLRGLVTANGITHVSQPFCKSGWADFWSEFGPQIRELQQKRFRTDRGLIVNLMFHYLAQSRGKALMRLEESHFLLNRYSLERRDVLLHRLQSGDSQLTRFCLNDCPTLGDDGWVEYLQEIFSLLDAREQPAPLGV